MSAPTTTIAAAHDASASLRVLVRPGEGLGFRLAGVPVDEIAAGDEAARLRALLADPAVAVLVVESELLAALPQAPLRRAAQRGLPIVLPFTLPRRYGDAGAGRDYLAALIRRAIGYHIKLDGTGGRR